MLTAKPYFRGVWWLRTDSYWLYWEDVEAHTARAYRRPTLEQAAASRALLR